MSDPVSTMFASSIRVSSAPTTSTKRAKSATSSRQKPKMNGVFEIPDTSRTGAAASSRRAKSARPAWSQNPPKKSKNPTPKPTVKKAELSNNLGKTKTIVKNHGGSKGSSSNSSPVSARMSVSQSFHIKGPELIESIRLTEDHVYQTEFERRDVAAGQIQRWWRKKQNQKSLEDVLRQKRQDYAANLQV